MYELYEPLNPFSIFVIGTGILLMFLQNSSMLNKKYLMPFFFIFAFKILLTWNNAYRYFDFPLLGADWVVFSKTGINILEDHPTLFQFFFDSEYSMIARLVAAVYYFFGINPVYVYFVMFFLSTFLFRYVILTAYEMSDDRDIAQKCGLLCMTWPILMIHSTTFLRELPINLFFIISFYYFVRYLKYRNIISFFGAFTWSIFATMLHSGMIAVWAMYCFFFTSIGRSGNIRISVPKALIGGLLVVTLIQSPVYKNMTAKFKDIEDAESLEDITEGISGDKTMGNTLYISSIPSNPIKLLALTPYLYTMFALAPLPYQIRSFGTLFSWFLDALPQAILLWLTYKYLYKERKRGSPQIKAYKTVGLWIVLFTYFIFCLGTSTYGTAIRHRAKITPMLLIFAVMYLDERKKEKYNFIQFDT